MNIYLSYNAGAGGDFLKICLWLLLHPEIEIDFEDAGYWAPTFVKHTAGAPPEGSTYVAEHDGVKYDLVALLNDGSVKPLTFLSNVFPPRHGTGQTFYDVGALDVANWHALRHGISFQEALTKIQSLEVANIKDRHSKYMTERNIKFKHQIFGQHEYYIIGDTYSHPKLFKDVYDLEIDTHIAIISKSPAEMLAITHLQEVKNEGYRSNFSYQSYYDNITELSLKLRNEIGVRDNILANGGLALGFKELHCSDAKTLAKILSKNIPGLTLSDTYLTWHKKYKQLNGIEQLLSTNKFKVADKLINDYQDEVDKWLS